jgi:Na+-translocating ferredoxin:NAD+ oxidoreductase RnfG subunit
MEILAALAALLAAFVYAFKKGKAQQRLENKAETADVITKATRVQESAENDVEGLSDDEIVRKIRELRDKLYRDNAK